MPDEKKTNLPDTTEDTSSTDLDVVPEDTAGNALDIVTNFISGLDPSTWLARNTSKAFNKLCSAPKGWFDAYFEGKAAETRARTDARVKIISEGTNQITQKMNVPVEYAQIALNKEMEKLIGERLNLDTTCAIAANDLQTTKSMGSTNQSTSQPNEAQSTDSTNQDAKSSEEKIIDDDWLNSFETEARQKTTEEMQLRFGRILAGEIRQPGSYSIKAVKLLGELDQNVAALFKTLCSIGTTLEKPIDGSIIDIRALCLSGDPAQNALSKYGLDFNSLNVLNEYGLIISHYNSSFSVYSIRENENYSEVILSRHQGKYWDISPLPGQPKKQEVKLYGVALSQVGRELFRIVDQDPMPEYTEDLKEFFARQKLQMVEVPGPDPIV